MDKYWKRDTQGQFSNMVDTVNIWLRCAFEGQEFQILEKFLFVIENRIIKGH